MLDRAKRFLVESYVGAIALGYLLAQDVMHFVNIFASPVASWISRKQLGSAAPGVATGFSLDPAAPELIKFGLLLLVWFLLMRWLYFKPLEGKSFESVANAEQPR